MKNKPRLSEEEVEAMRERVRKDKELEARFDALRHKRAKERGVELPERKGNEELD